MNKETIDIKNGGEEALVEAMNKYSQGILRYCHNILCNYHDAQDALQVTFIKAYQRRSSFKEDMSLSPWLYKIAYTTCADILKKRRITADITKYQIEEDDKKMPEDIVAALNKLNYLDRAIVYARVMEQVRYNELAERHGKSPAYLRKRYERAIKKLAEELEDEYPFYARKEQTPQNGSELI